MPAADALLKLYNESRSFLSVYPDFDLSKLPDWVAANIHEARVYGGDLKGVILKDGRKYHLKNKLNDMNGRDWTFFINSVFVTNYPTRGRESYAHEIRKIHPTPKPPQLMRDLILFFTKKGETVLDMFMGVGGTLLGAGLAQRKAIGIDLNPKYITAYEEAAKSLNLPVFPSFCGDALNVLDQNTFKNVFTGQKAGLILIDPPFANMMSRIKTGADTLVYGEVATPFTHDPADLGNMQYSDHLEKLRAIVDKALQFLKTEGYVVVFTKDLQPHGKAINLLHYDVISCLNAIPCLNYKGMKIWADMSSKIYPYGYPFSFVANQIHQYILIFRKEKKASSRRCPQQ